mgnify:CR=1 FL=1
MKRVEAPSRKKEPSILPITLVGVMLIDELIDEPGMGGIPTRLILTKNGIDLRRGLIGDQRKIIARLKAAIATLEAEQEAATNVLH